MTILRRIVSFAAAAAVAVTCVASSGVFAENTDDEQHVDVEWNMGYSREVVLENYERLMAANPAETGVISFDDGIMPYDGNIPKLYHNWGNGDYHFLGESTNRLFTLKYFSTTADGKICLEGYFETRNVSFADYMWQGGIIEIYDHSTNKCVGKFNIDDRYVLSKQKTFSLYYFNFTILNLDPNKLYYFGFVDEVFPSGLEVSGYVSNHATFYFWDQVHGTDNIANFTAEVISDDDKYVGEPYIEDVPGFHEIIEEMRRSDDPLALYERSREF